MPSISVIIPSYNRKSFLIDCLNSVFEQSHSPLEIIVVDDGSTDGTVDALSIFGNGIKLVQQVNAGPGAARNHGAQVASGDYLAFLDSDDLWFPWTLVTFTELIERHHQPQLLFGRYVDFEVRSELEIIHRAPAVGDAFANYLASNEKGYFCGAGMMVIAREAFFQAAGFAEGFLNAEDHDLALSLGIVDGFIQVLAPLTVGHRIHGGNEMADLGKTLRGLERLVANEKAGNYPGGKSLAAARRDIIGRHVRSAVVSAARTSHSRDAWELYRKTFGWNLRMGRVAFLFGAPLLAMKSSLARK